LERENKPKLLNRLNRIEGQVRGVARMVEEDRYCIDILTQLRALSAAINKVEGELLRTHLEHCVAGAMASNDAEERRRKTDELIELLDRSGR
jgi:CsoR family transcriptional regulator, copper-sensing transcriptional repressor